MHDGAWDSCRSPSARRTSTAPPRSTPTCSARPPTARFDPPGLLFFDLDGVRLLLDVNAPSALLYLRVDDVAATVERLRGRGVVVESEPHVIFRHEDDTLGPAGTDEWHAFVRDSEGNLVGLVQLG